MLRQNVREVKVFLTLMIAMIVTIGVFQSLTIAKANNSSDSDYCFSFVYGGEDRTTWREKTDPSGVYLYCYDSSDSNECFYADVYGSNTTVGSGTYCGNDYSYPVYEGMVFYMYNWVYENYNSNNTSAFAYILGSASYPYVADFSCYWSPDNYQGYAGE